MSDAIVECYSGISYPDKPRAFIYDDRRHKVAAVFHEWRQEDGKTFLVQTEDYLLFKLFFDEIMDQWQVTPYRMGDE